MISFIFKTIFAICLWQICLAEVRYDYYKLYKVLTQTKNQTELLNEFEGNSDSVIFISRNVNESVVIVAPHKDYDFRLSLQNEKTNFTIIETNIQRILEKEKSVSGKREAFGWTDYHTLHDINQWMMGLTRMYPNVVSLQRLGQSYEKRDILGIKISHKPKNKAVFIEGGIHAREWISPATTTYIINQLLTSNSSDIQYLAQNYDWYVFPSVNPDGYVHTHEKDRLWRKTRKPNRSCFGTDPNRNFDVAWNSVGTSNHTCSEIYAGRGPFSEQETFSISKYASRIKDLRAYIAFHSYSQLLLFPYGHTEELPDNYDDLMEISQATIDELAVRYGTKYRAGNVYHAIYPAAGSSMDWAYEKLGIRLAFTYELRPTSYWSRSGFELPREEIIPTGEETMDSLVAFMRSARDLGYFY